MNTVDCRFSKYHLCKTILKVPISS
jgi:hypothetical protein